jgi:hypothetical protein
VVLSVLHPYGNLVRSIEVKKEFTLLVVLKSAAWILGSDGNVSGQVGTPEVQHIRHSIAVCLQGVRAYATCRRQKARNSTDQRGQEVHALEVSG